MSQRSISVDARYDVPPDVLWEVAADHEGMTRWLGAEVRVIAGPADGGVGTVRRIRAGALHFDEEVTWVDPPRRMVYRILRGIPLLRYHQGEMRVEPWGDGQSQLVWEVTLDTWLPGLTGLLAAVLRHQLRVGLRRLGDLLTEGS